jgi:hypothetical protein
MKTNEQFKHIDLRSQNGRILKHLLQGRKITQLEALQRFGCLRLSGRIYDLKEAGYLIECELHTTNNGKRVGRYFIKKENRKIIE